jgi:hypothetical protein
MLVLAGLSWVETPQVGHGKGAGELGAGLAVEAAGTGMSVALAETASSGSFETYLFLFDEAGEANAMRLPFRFTCWFFLLLGAHGFVNSVQCLRWILC